MRKLTVFLILAGSLVMSGCGFHLRNAQANHLAWSSMEVSSGATYQYLQSEIHRQISAGRVTFTPQGPATTLLITDEHFTERDLSYSRTGEVRRKRIGYQLTFTVKDAQNNLIFGPHQITTARDQLLNPTQDLADNIELSDIRKTLQHEAISLLFLRLGSYDH